MLRRLSKILSVAVAIGFGVTTPLLPGAAPEAFAFGHGGGGHFGGGHFGGGHFGGFHGGHFGGFRGGHFGGFRGGHFGGRHFGGGHFGHFGGGRFAHGAAGGRLGGGRFGQGAHFGRGTAFAGNRMGHAAAFHGFHGLNQNGFNRNGFGNMRGWNNWGHGNWGQGWNNWGYGYGDWAGPVFWPYFYGDMLTFALWPYAYYNPFFFYGPDLLLTSIFWPGPALCPFYGYCSAYAYNDGYGPYDGYYGYGDYSGFDVYDYPPNSQYDTAYYHRWRHHRRHIAHHYPNPAAGAAENIAATCGGLAPDVTQLPIDRIQRTIDATDDQATILDQVQAASNQANQILLSACPTVVPLTPIDRLDAVSNRLQAMIRAVDVLRGPLTTFYASLDDRQKVELAAAGRRGSRRAANVAVNEAPAQDLAALCQKQAQSFTLLPVQRIDDIVKPTADQQAAYEALKAASSSAAAGLDASCPSTMPETIEGRLDAVVTRLQALENAVSAVKPSLETFYASLSDEQKARFNVIGSMNMAAAPPVDGKTGTGR